jgi:hypothetical protein
LASFDVKGKKTLLGCDQSLSALQIGDVMKVRELQLTPKGQRPFFGPFLDIGQAIVDAIFVQKISNFW